jgi:hypothetical protein
LFINLDDPLAEIYYITITTLEGRVAMMLPQPQWQNGIDVSSLSTGVYILKMMDKATKSITTKKFVKKDEVNLKVDKAKLALLMPDTYFKGRGIDPLVLNKHQVGYWQRTDTYMDKRAIVPVFNDDGDSKFSYFELNFFN